MRTNSDNVDMQGPATREDLQEFLTKARKGRREEVKAILNETSTAKKEKNKNGVKAPVAKLKAFVFALPNAIQCYRLQTLINYYQNGIRG
jgi:hypothetical protein